MQTLLPHPSFEDSARVLDDRRLGKQRVETLQILRALHLDGYGWSNHPAVLMWRGRTQALVAYGVVVVEEWRRRGFTDGTRDDIVEFVYPEPVCSQEELAVNGLLPGWLGDGPFHASHRSALLRKSPEHYQGHFPTTHADLDYVWPAPPTPPRPPGRRDAWVVRSQAHPDRVAVPALPGELAAARSGASPKRRTKRLRQVERLVTTIREGDVVVTPTVAGVLRVGRVAGPYEARRRHHVLPVDWVAELRRAELSFPAALQDPQQVFPLYDEPLFEPRGVLPHSPPFWT